MSQEEEGVGVVAVALYLVAAVVDVHWEHLVEVEASDQMMHSRGVMASCWEGMAAAVVDVHWEHLVEVEASDQMMHSRGVMASCWEGLAAVVVDVHWKHPVEVVDECAAVWNHGEEAFVALEICCRLEELGVMKIGRLTAVSWPPEERQAEVPVVSLKVKKLKFHWRVEGTT
jgi:hypothetical protein